MKQILLATFFLLLSTTSAWALTTEPLSGEVFIGPAAGELGFGSFTYDESLLTGVGEESLDPIDGLMLEFTFLGTTFFETDDIDFDGFPILSFFDGVPESLDFIVVDGDGVGTEIGDPRLDGFSIFDLEPDLAGGYFGEISTFFNVVPEPTSMALLGLGLSLWGANYRRRKY